MRLAIIGDELDQDLDTVINAVKARGFDGIEVRSVWNMSPPMLSDEKLLEIHESILKSNLAIAGFDSPGFKIPLPQSDIELEACRTTILRSIEQARLLGSGFVRFFTFYRDGDANPKLAAKIVQSVLEDIIPEDLAIYFETGMRTNTPTMKHILQFMDVIGDNRFGVVWDPGNSVFSGAEKNPFPNDYKVGRDVIKHVHVKDPIGQREYTRLGDGDLPWQDIINTLRNDGYKGYLSLETHWRIGRVLDQNQRDNPWYNAFSAGGYKASEVCMDQLLSYVRRST